MKRVDKDFKDYEFFMVSMHDFFDRIPSYDDIIIAYCSAAVYWDDKVRIGISKKKRKLLKSYKEMFEIKPENI